jgi:carboxyl-terminal processing protease
MVVLINRNSASASEIVAGALQDHDRALIVGETSFGKALVQTIYPLPGSRGLALTTGKYYTPSDRLIQRDYSEGFYDYFYTRAGDTAQEVEKHRTDTGRPVFGGGGIAPDEEVSLEKASRLYRQIVRLNLFYKFAQKLSTGEIQSDIRYHYTADELKDLSAEGRDKLAQTLSISEKTLTLFKEFLREQGEGIRFTDESFEQDHRLLANRIRRELFLSMFGEEQGYEVALELDRQVQRAVELLPRALALLQERAALK